MTWSGVPPSIFTKASVGGAYRQGLATLTGQALSSVQLKSLLLANGNEYPLSPAQLNAINTWTPSGASRADSNRLLEVERVLQADDTLSVLSSIYIGMQDKNSNTSTAADAAMSSILANITSATTSQNGVSTSFNGFSTTVTTQTGSGPVGSINIGNIRTERASGVAVSPPAAIGPVESLGSAGLAGVGLGAAALVCVALVTTFYAIRNSPRWARVAAHVDESRRARRRGAPREAWSEDGADKNAPPPARRKFAWEEMREQLQKEHAERVAAVRAAAEAKRPTRPPRLAMRRHSTSKDEGPYSPAHAVRGFGALHTARGGTANPADDDAVAMQTRVAQAVATAGPQGPANAVKRVIQAIARQLSGELGLPHQETEEDEWTARSRSESGSYTHSHTDEIDDDEEDVYRAMGPDGEPLSSDGVQLAAAAAVGRRRGRRRAQNDESDSEDEAPPALDGAAVHATALPGRIMSRHVINVLEAQRREPQDGPPTQGYVPAHTTAQARRRAEAYLFDSSPDTAGVPNARVLPRVASERMDSARNVLAGLPNGMME